MTVQLEQNDPMMHEGERLDSQPAEGERTGRARRRSERRKFRVDLTLESEHNLYCGFSTDISSGGLFIATHVPLAIGAHITVRMALPGRPFPVTVEARVCWVA